MTNRLLSFLMALTALCVANTSQAALLAYNGFDGNATGFSSNSVPNDLGNSLTYTDSSGNVLDTVDGASGSFFQNSMTLSAATATDAKVYASFIVQQITANERFRFDFINSGTEGGPEVVSQFTAPNAVVGFKTGPPANIFVPGDTLASVTGTNFFVLEFDPVAGSVSAWGNPVLDNPGAPTPPLTNVVNLQGLSLDTIELVFGGDFRFDEIRIGTSFADVTPFTPIPEPTSAALVLGGLGLLALRSRGRRR